MPAPEFVRCRRLDRRSAPGADLAELALQGQAIRLPQRRRRAIQRLIAQCLRVKLACHNHGREAEMIRSILLAAFIATFAGGAAFAQETCESKAVGKDGKALAGAAKTSFMKKCMADSCAAKAVSADGKPLSGAAKTSFMTKCEKGGA
jgi:hypothetical protein